MMSSPEKSPKFEDLLEDEHGRLSKRFKKSNQEWSLSSDQSVPPSLYNPLDEPSPLGLKLRKSPSLLDLIQMKLTKSNASSGGSASAKDSKVENKKDVKASSIDKLKASNFLASLLRIGDWEYVSRYEGDLVAKCYFSKHKLVWELLEGGLKCKIEMQWSDIVYLSASCPNDKPGYLTIVLGKPPLFFKETNPEPRKHTLWQATTDFTAGQASVHRQHLLQCPQGVLNKHYEKLIQCDMRLKCLSQQSQIILDKPYFVSQACGSGSNDISRYQEFNQLDAAKVVPILNFQNVAVPCEIQSPSLDTDQMCTTITSPHHLSKGACSPSSGVLEPNGNFDGQSFPGLKNWEHLKVPGLHQSMSMNDLVEHIEHHISEQMTSGKAYECKDTLDNISQLLLSDSQTITALDEKSLMSRVDSLCRLLQDPVTVSNDQVDRETLVIGPDGFDPKVACDPKPPSMFELSTTDHGNGVKDVPSCKQEASMSRTDSFGNLLLHLPRVASFPTVLYDISEDGENHSF